MSQIVILGAGDGGLTSANELQRLLGEKHKIILIDKRKKYHLGLTKLWVMIGKRLPEECEREISNVEKKGIRFVNDEVVKINIEEKKVYTTTNYFKYDYLIIALGADISLNSISGFKDGALNLYDINSVHQIYQEIEKFYRGNIVLLIPRTPFKCPAAPYEACFLLDDYFRKKGRRESIKITICTSEPHPLPSAGRDCGVMMSNMLLSRDISLRCGVKVISIDNQRKMVLFENENEERFDLLIGVPVHSSPAVVKEFTNENNWIPVDKNTLKTSTQNVYAIGDVSGIKLSNGILLPKSGVFAEEQAKVVAFNIIAEINETNDKKEFQGNGYCFLETGNEEAIRIDGSFFEEPMPKVVVSEIKKENYNEKVRFEKKRLEEWF
jgi:sulfide:quinone oxidoreductase